jgi:hypothetical protein
MRNGVGADADDAILHCLGRCLSESEFVIVLRFGLIRAGDGQTTEGAMKSMSRCELKMWGVDWL